MQSFFNLRQMVWMQTNAYYTVFETYAKINFNFDTQTPLEIPLRDPKVEEYPFTGRGFTGSKK